MTTPRIAAVSPYAAAWIVSRLGRDGGAHVRAQAALLRDGFGAPALAGELEASWAQLRAAAADHQTRTDREQTSGSASELPSPEWVPGDVAAESISTAREISTAAAGVLLGNLTSRAVIYRLVAGSLSGRKVGGRWLVDLDSVNAVAAERKYTS